MNSVTQNPIMVLSTASALPGPLISNETLLDQLEVLCGKRARKRASALVRRLGIESRHLVRRLDQRLSAPNPTAPALAQQAMAAAMQEAGIQQPDYLISHTATPHTLIPGNAAWLCQRMQITAPYMELRQACTGFANALQIIHAMLHSQAQDIVAVSSCETGSVYFDMHNDFIDTDQLVNYVQMGDAAAAALFSRPDDTGRYLISDCFIGHLGLEDQPGFELVGGGSGNPVCDKNLPYFRHNPRAVRDKGPRLFIKGLEAVLNRGYHLDDFDYIIPHQANGHIDTLLAEHLGIDASRIINEARTLGNLGSSAIWVCFDQLRHSGRLKPGDKVLILGAEATQYMYGGFVYQH
ncbi:3-oxoacyl-[acyl-carrier-protein] synthase 3 [BD1-7 clade bacterium]|uniref:3-oxoacyl-[acyl-carrier-protein] synthase 3 n=1 Tax=BD1-7 clade bacterium TaxID=2029982 RepID=A0A5S9QZT9_9GAMM|nr:3-oxoacyl-[acyl-carrier-protein] synthase 3 [BD1-7 clade bacterium]